MRVTVEQIGSELEKRQFPVYLICGDEPLQHGEAADAIRLAFKNLGFADREVFDVEVGFNWGRFEMAARSLPLFSQKRLLELRFGSGLPDKNAVKCLLDYTERPPDDTVLLVSCGKLSKSTTKAAWFQTLDRLGAVIQVRLLLRNKLLVWLDARMKTRGVRMDQPALKALAIRVEGNMLAAAQEIDKLYVLYGSSQLDSAKVNDVVVNSAHYDVFDLVDCTLAGKMARSHRILNTLRLEGLAAQVVLWALSRELRVLAKIRFDLDRGAARAVVFRNQRIWDSRKPLMDAALRRLETKQIHEFVKHCAYIDQVGKGLSKKGDVWDELWFLCLSIAGKNPLEGRSTYS